MYITTYYKEKTIYNNNIMDSTDKEDSIYSINNTQDKAEHDTKILPKKRGRPRKNK